MESGRFQLSLRVVAIVALFAILVPVGVGVWAVRAAGSALADQARQGQAAVTDAASAELAQGIRSALASIHSAARLPGLIAEAGETDPVGRRRTLQAISRSAPVETVGVYDDEGRLLASEPGQVRKGLAAAAPDAPIYLPPVAIGDDAMIAVAEPIMNSQGLRVGTLVADVSLRQAAPGLSELQLGSTSTAVLVGADRKVLLAVGESRTAATTRLQAMLAAVGGGSGQAVYARPGGRRELATARPVFGYRLSLLVSQSETEIRGPADHLNRVVAAGLVVMVLFAQMAGLAVAGHLGSREYRLRAQTEALTRSEEQFRAMFSNALVGTFLTTPGGRFQQVNQAMSDLLGYDADDFTRRDWRSVTLPEDRDQVALLTTETMAGERRGFTVHTRYVHADGHVVHALLSTTLLRERSGEPSSFVGHVVDVTARTELEAERARQAAELAAANEELRAVGQLKDDLVAMLSHDIAQPLAGILGYSEMLSDDWAELPDDRRRACVTRVHRQARRLQQMLEEILAMYQLDAGTLRADPIAVRLDNAVSGTVELLDLTVEHIHVRDVRPVTAQVDPGHVQQMLMNLLTNAGKYGAPPIVVDAGGAGPGWVELIVRDHGEGVPEEFVPRLFDRWARATTGQATVRKGSGLGLFLVRALAEANGGTVEYRPNRPSGACFVLRLPAATGAPAGGDAPGIATRPVGSPASTGGSGR
jgi:PAS domain S-box-containing protein